MEDIDFERMIENEDKVDNLKKYEPDKDTMRILIASDVHLGYCEIDTDCREKDSFRALDEVLELANETHADMVLLGGDLFHENNPSRSSQVSCIRIIRAHTFGKKRSRLQYLSDYSLDFRDSHFPQPNYLDEDLNIKMPVFSISGNHDDITGSKCQSVLDVLQESKLINYFGKYTSEDKLTLSPIVVKVGCTAVAIYGLNSMKDERLHRAFSTNAVHFERASCNEKTFNMMAIHQNRVPRGSETNYIPEYFLPSLLDFVVWGHEHDPQPESSPGMETLFLQPGSTVATSLAEGEKGAKYCYMLEVKKEDEYKFECTPIALKSTRQFKWASVALDELGVTLPDCTDRDLLLRLENLCVMRVNEMVVQCEEERNKERQHFGIGVSPVQMHKYKRPKLPLIRLRVDIPEAYAQFRKPVETRFCQRFAGIVANPRNVVTFLKKAGSRTKKSTVDKAAMASARDKQNKQQLSATVENIVTEYFSQMDVDSENRMQVVSESVMKLAVQQFVNGTKSAPGAFIRAQRDKMRDVLKKQLAGCNEGELTLSTVTEAIGQVRTHRLAKSAENPQVDPDADVIRGVDATLQTMPKGTQSSRTLSTSSAFANEEETRAVDESDDEMETMPAPSVVKTRGRGRGRGRATGAKGDENRASARGRPTKSKIITQDDSRSQSSSIASIFAPKAKKAKRAKPTESEWSDDEIVVPESQPSQNSSRLSTISTTSKSTLNTSINRKTYGIKYTSDDSDD